MQGAAAKETSLNELFLGLAVVGVLVLVLGLLSRPFERLPLSGPMAAMLLGAALGPAALDLLHPAQWGDLHTLLEEAARLTIAIGLMSIALHLPPQYPSQQWRSLLVLLALVMPLMALIGGALAYALFGGPLLLALLVGAILCPTDPIVATSIVTGKVAERDLPARLRHLLLGESGANDGLAYPLVWLPLLLLAGSGNGPWQQWLLHTLLWQVGGGVVAGAALGYAGGRLLCFAEQHHTIEVTSFFAYTIALTFLTFGAAELLGGNSLLAVFASGLAFAHLVGDRERKQEERVQEAINGFFTVPIFVLIGLAIPWEAWLELGWRGSAFVALILLLRRLPALWLLRHAIPALRATPDLLFAGWFGPIGVAALFYAVVSAQHTGEDLVWTLASMTICASVLVHGATASPFIALYRRAQAALPEKSR